jgi:glycosyltransferase involved in cell wall biosynthesis
MFVIVIRGWNCAKYLERCFESLLAQSNKDWRAHVILDPGQDNSEACALSASFASDGRISVTVNSRREGVGRNIYHGISQAKPGPEDIVCILDADDWLYPFALEVVAHTYFKKKCLATYGSFELESSMEKSSICKPYGRHDVPRKSKWRASHLKTFKGKVFDHIPPCYLQHNGMWVTHASDLALMMSVMEVAGIDRCQHIPRVLYHYRNQTPYTQDRAMQKKYDKIIRAKKPLHRVEF